MGIRSESRLTISASAAAIYDYLADAARWPEWARAILECHVAGGGPMRPGSQLEQRAKALFGRTRSRTLDVDIADSPTRLMFSGSMGPSPMRWGFEFAQRVDRGTDVLMWLEAELRGPMRMLPQGAFVNMVRKVNQRELIAIDNAVAPRPELAAAN